MITGAEIKQALGALKIAADIANKAGKLAEFQKIIELQGMLLEMQEQMAEKQGRIDTLQRENDELKVKFHIAKKMELKNNAYYDDGDGPFCTTCWDVKQMKIRLTPLSLDSIYATCNACRPKDLIQIKEDTPDFSYSEPLNLDPYL